MALNGLRPFGIEMGSHLADGPSGISGSRYHVDQSRYCHMLVFRPRAHGRRRNDANRLRSANVPPGKLTSFFTAIELGTMVGRRVDLLTDPSANGDAAGLSKRNRHFHGAARA